MKLPKNHRDYQSGFTLVELLIVIAIIAFLVASFFPNYMAARERARDGQRKSDISQIQKALELYKLDQQPPAYPTTGAFDPTMCNTCWSTGPGCTGNVYMRKVPCDPGSIQPTPYIYAQDITDNLRYTVVACLENPVDSDRDTDPNGQCQASSTSYTLHEP